MQTQSGASVGRSGGVASGAARSRKANAAAARVTAVRVVPRDDAKRQKAEAPAPPAMGSAVDVVAAMAASADVSPRTAGLMQAAAQAALAASAATPALIRFQLRHGVKLTLNDVGNIVNAGIGGFPNAIYRDWWAPLWPTSCFAVGNYGLWSLAQCVMFTGTF